MGKLLEEIRMEYVNHPTYSMPPPYPLSGVQPESNSNLLTLNTPSLTPSQTSASSLLGIQSNATTDAASDPSGLRPTMFEHTSSSSDVNHIELPTQNDCVTQMPVAMDTVAHSNVPQSASEMGLLVQPPVTIATS